MYHATTTSRIVDNFIIVKSIFRGVFGPTLVAGKCLLKSQGSDKAEAPFFILGSSGVQ